MVFANIYSDLISWNENLIMIDKSFGVNASQHALLYNIYHCLNLRTQSSSHKICTVWLSDARGIMLSRAVCPSGLSVHPFFHMSMRLVHIVFRMHGRNGLQLTKFTNSTMNLSHISQCTIQNRNVHCSVLNNALWDMGEGYCGISEVGLFGMIVHLDYL